MERIAEWRPIEAAEAAQPAAASAGVAPRSPAAIVGLALLGCALTGALALLLWTVSPRPELVLEQPGTPMASSPVDGAGPPASDAVVIVDVQGAVAAAGLYALPAGSRVGDAIVAAGGYGASVDIDAAASQLNLAARLADGDKVIVPWLGAAVPASAGPATGGPPGAGLVDLNSADEAALDTLPGVGPVTAAKIIAARAEAPFTSVDDLLARGVVGAATLDKLRPLATVGP